jgi:hypothetical protein
MASSHKKRFARWRKSLNPRTAFLVDQVLEVLLPPLFAQGFVWADNIEEFGAIADSRADSIPLQRRSGAAWPTITIDFDQRKRSKFRIEFAVLPEYCFHRGQSELLRVPRREARIYDGPLYLWLVRGERKSDDSRFGYDLFDFISQPYRIDRLLRYTFAPGGLLAEEVRFAQRCMADIDAALVSGLPHEWQGAPLGRIGRHLYLIDSDPHRQATYANIKAHGAPAAPSAATGEPLPGKEEEDEEEDFETDIAGDPVLSAIDTDLKTAWRHAKLLRNLLLAGAVATGVGYLLMQPRSEPVRVTMVSLLLGAFPAQLVFWAWAARRVAARHGLVCPSCGQTPPAPEVMRTAIKRRCPRCSAKMSNASP